MLDVSVSTVPSDKQIAVRMPRVGVPFLDAFEIMHGPPSLLGRFFLQSDAYLRQHGLALEFANFEELIDVQARNKDSWPYIAPMFDSRVADIDPQRTFCVVVRRQNGDVMATVSAKAMDARVRSFKQIVEDGEFVGVRAVAGEPATTSTISAPTADQMHGELLYSGGIWVHPDMRGLRLAAFTSHLASAISFALWDPDLIIGMIAPSVVNTDLGKRYGCNRVDHSVIVSKGGVPYYEGVLIWMTREDALLDMARFLDGAWPKVDTTVAASRRQ